GSPGAAPSVCGSDPSPPPHARGLARGIRSPSPALHPAHPPLLQTPPVLPLQSLPQPLHASPDRAASTGWDAQRIRTHSLCRSSNGLIVVCLSVRIVSSQTR